MMRSLLAAAAAALVCLSLGCGSDAAVINAPADIAVPPAPDLAAPSGSCGPGNAQACGGSCAACLLLGAAGVCVTPCRTTQPSCPSGQTCHAIPGGGGADGGTAFGSVELAGACGGIDGYCG